MNSTSAARVPGVVAVIRSRPFAIANRLRVAVDLDHSVEYLIEVQPDGSTRTLQGPPGELRPGFFTRLLLKLGFVKRLV